MADDWDGPVRQRKSNRRKTPKPATNDDDLVDGVVERAFHDARAFRIETLVKLYKLPETMATAMDTALIEMAWQLDVQAVRDASPKPPVYCPTCGFTHVRPVHPWED
jgi:hypothetical protein